MIPMKVYKKGLIDRGCNQQIKLKGRTIFLLKTLGIYINLMCYKNAPNENNLTVITRI